MHTLRQALQCARSEGDVLPAHTLLELEQLRQGLLESEAHYEQLQAQVDVTLAGMASPSASLGRVEDEEERARKRRELQGLRAVYEYALGVTARLFASVSAVLDPHVSVEEQEHVLTAAAAEEAERESAALSAWSCAIQCEGSERGGDAVGGAGADAHADADGREGVLDDKINEACLRYKTGAAPLDAMDDLCGILKESHVSPQLASRTLHTR